MLSFALLRGNGVAFLFDANAQVLFLARSRLLVL